VTVHLPILGVHLPDHVADPVIFLSFAVGQQIKCENFGSHKKHCEAFLQTATQAPATDTRSGVIDFSADSLGQGRDSIWGARRYSPKEPAR